MTMFKPNHLFHRAPFFFFFIIIFYLFIFPYLHCKLDTQYSQCHLPYSCGRLTDISYPFWGGSNRPQYCGRLGFELTNCQDESQLPRIKINDLNFHVLSINSQDHLHTMTIARSDLWDSPCTDLLVNTTLDYNRFSYAQTVRNLTLFYGCVPQNESSLKHFTCRSDGTTSDRDIAYYSDDLHSSRVDLLNRSCFSKLRVSIFSDAFDVMPQNATAEVEKALRQGFQVEYSAEWDLCRQCLDPIGTCGSDATTDSFLCLYSPKIYWIGGTILGNLSMNFLIFFSCSVITLPNI